MRRVVLVAGSPCSGKTTYVAQHAEPGDLVLDQDELGPTRYQQMLAQVAAMQDGTAWVIRCAPGPTARRHLAAQIRATDVVLLNPPLADLRARAARRSNPRRAHAAVMAWLRAEAQDPPALRPRRQGKGSTTARGYGAAHQRERARWRPTVEAGNATCWRCGDPIDPAEPWDLGHDDDDRDAEYRGPEHAGRCNRAEAARRTNAKRRTRRAPRILRSRDW